MPTSTATSTALAALIATEAQTVQSENRARLPAETMNSFSFNVHFIKWMNGAAPPKELTPAPTIFHHDGFVFLLTSPSCAGAQPPSARGLLGHRLLQPGDRFRQLFQAKTPAPVHSLPMMFVQPPDGARQT